MYENSNYSLFLSIDEDFDLKLDIIDLQICGLTTDELQGYLDFFSNATKEKGYDFI